MTIITVTDSRTSRKMASQPTLLRSTPERPSLREAIAGQIRNECGKNSWTCVELAQILNVTVERARHLYFGRRCALLDELELLCMAVEKPIVKFMDEATERRNLSRVFADTTFSELCEMAAQAGTTPDRLIRSQGWSSRSKADVPSHLGGNA